eukprot:1362873-Lingulodinium_polyedra.AAC.1
MVSASTSAHFTASGQESTGLLSCASGSTDRAWHSSQSSFRQAEFMDRHRLPMGTGPRESPAECKAEMSSHVDGSLGHERGEG